LTKRINQRWLPLTGSCISAINGQSFPGMGQWAVISNLRMDCEGYDGPISQEISATTGA
jgi:hypothetical protein